MNRRVKLEKHKYDLVACIEFSQISEKKSKLAHRKFDLGIVQFFTPETV